MPKFVGSDISNVVRIGDNAFASGYLVRLSYSQARLLPYEAVRKSLDTSDRGGPRSLAKRWYRWFGDARAIVASTRSTKKMLAAACCTDHEDCAKYPDLGMECRLRSGRSS